MNKILQDIYNIYANSFINYYFYKNENKKIIN